ncbi:ABC transporter ATP-binding protein [Cupriavidus necator]|nr:ABC transporter ATP-binding protein [Cupriavidus necator]QQX83633.1 ABC transporter ATP-binding protein [Cupriavidus necator]
MELLSAGRKQYARETRALDDVSFALEKGGRLGIVGENGSGKSTLLKVLARVLTPSSGTVQVSGRVSALLELGAGFNPELTGRENISQFGLLHGMSREQIEAAQPEIIQFSELRDAIDHPVKTYSSGMAVRLGFACAVYVQPDILIVDEALSVGDAYFQNKCLHKIRSMLDGGVTFIYVTHAADAIRSLCNQGLWMEKGRVRLCGSSTEVGAGYQREIFNRMVKGGYADAAPDPAGRDADSEGAGGDDAAAPARASHAPLAGEFDSASASAFGDRVAPMRTGSGEARILDIVLYDDDGNATDSVAFRRPHRLRVIFSLKAPVPPNTSLNVGIADNSGKQVCHFSSLVQDIDLANLDVGAPYSIEFDYHPTLCPGEYGITAGISSMVDHPSRHGQMVVDSVVDYCAGGQRFSIRFPDYPLKADLWGVVAIDYSADLTKLD